MNKSDFVSILFLSMLVVACGGNGDRAEKHKSSSSSSLSSSAPSSNCDGVEGAVFIDGVCAPWLQVSAYEQLNWAPWTNREFTDGSTGDAVAFSIMTSTDTGRSQVLDVQYADTSDYSAVVRMLAPENGVDMREYASGKIQFDIKLIDEGYDEPDLEFVIECGYPCASTPKIVKPNLLNEWQTFEYSIADLIDSGLDVENVSLGFMLSPTWEKQTGVHFQLDNIRWVKGSPVVATQETCFANHFDSPWIQGVSGHGVMTLGEDFVVPGNQLIGLTLGVNPYVKAVPDWSQMQGKWKYSLSEAISYMTNDLLEPSALSACSFSGVLTIDVYVSDSLVSDGTITFTVHFVDEENNYYELPNSLTSVSSLNPNDWNRISINLSAETQHDNLKYVGLTIDSSAVDNNLDGYFYVDNILIKRDISK